jgi:hypothetical protein
MRQTEDIDSCSGGPHRDYSSNLAHAEKFCQNVQKSLLNGMRVYISNSNEIPQCLLNIVFKPPQNAKLGISVNSIFLHQPSDAFKKEIETTINIYMLMAKKFWDYRKEKQEDFLDAVKA